MLAVMVGGPARVAIIADEAVERADPTLAAVQRGAKVILDQEIQLWRQKKFQT